MSKLKTEGVYPDFTLRSGLPLSTLRYANVHRLPEFKNCHGETAHSEPDGSDWTPGEWMNACVGEVGEAANLIKKLRRGDLTIDEARPLIAKELADAVTYIDIVAFQLGINLESALFEKWNEVSERVGSRVYIGKDGDFHFKGR